MATLSIVRATAPTRCACSLCRHPGARINREYIERVCSYLSPEDLELEVANSWHAYHPALLAVAEQLPPFAVHASCTAKPTRALTELLRWNDGDDEDDGDQNIVVLSGPPGTGKTLAAVWLLLHRLANQDPLFMSAFELARVSRTGEARDELLDRMRSVFVIDDLGAERLDEKFCTDMDEIFDRFYQGYGQLIVTTNCNASQFRKRYGMRVVDRLAERGRWITISGASMRVSGRHSTP